jgi:serine/threonine-protein kinase RsbT
MAMVDPNGSVRAVAKPVREELQEIVGEDGIVAARQLARLTARALGFSLVDQSRIATAVSELARNVVRYATGHRGQIRVRGITGAKGTGLEIVVSDEGPGIEDIELAMQAGFSSGSGLGMGLSGTRRLMDEMLIQSAPGQGTVVTIRKWRR